MTEQSASFDRIEAHTAARRGIDEVLAWRQQQATDQVAIVPLLEQLASAGYAVETLDALPSPLPPGAQEILCTWIGGPPGSPRMQLWIVSILGEKQARLAIADLVRAFQSEPPLGASRNFRWHVAEALGRLARWSDPETFISLAGQSQWGADRQMLVANLWRVRDPAIHSVALAALDDEHDAVKFAALQFFRRCPSCEAIPSIEAMTRSSNAELRAEARRTLRVVRRKLS